jgi:hypothetical protein
MCNCRSSVPTHGRRPPRWPNASSRPSAARFCVSKHPFTRFHALIMTSFTLRQLDRTRQTGSARLGASWYAPMRGAASQAGVIGITIGEFKSVGGRDSRPQDRVGAVTVSGESAP